MSIAEVEEVFAGVVLAYPDVEHSHTETRFLAIGQTTKGRHVFLAFTFRGHSAERLMWAPARTCIKSAGLKMPRSPDLATIPTAGDTG